MTEVSRLLLSSLPAIATEGLRGGSPRLSAAVEGRSLHVFFVRAVRPIACYQRRQTCVGYKYIAQPAGLDTHGAEGLKNSPLESIMAVQTLTGFNRFNGFNL
jgi:hypothetical protein